MGHSARDRIRTKAAPCAERSSSAESVRVRPAGASVRRRLTPRVLIGFDDLSDFIRRPPLTSVKTFLRSVVQKKTRSRPLGLRPPRAKTEFGLRGDSAVRWTLTKSLCRFFSIFISPFSRTPSLSRSLFFGRSLSLSRSCVIAFWFNDITQPSLECIYGLCEYTSVVGYIPV